MSTIEKDFPAEEFEFEVWCSKLPDCDDEPFVIKQLLPVPVLVASSCDLFPGSLEFIDTHFWCGSEKIDSHGLWKLDCKVFYETSSDWESGHTETTMYISIEKAEKV